MNDECWRCGYRNTDPGIHGCDFTPEQPVHYVGMASSEHASFEVLMFGAWYAVTTPAGVTCPICLKHVEERR